MGTRVVAIVAAVMVAGCGQRQDSFACTDDAQCGAGGKCEPVFNLCSFADPSCGPDGRSFGDLGGANSGRCVNSTPLPDGGPDAPPDMPPRLCYGTDPFMICLANAPTMPLTLNSATPLDTMTSNLCVATTSGGANYCVVAATTISIEVKLRATGAKPLVLLASDTITVNAPIDVGSHRSAAPEMGAGADPPSPACAAGTLPGAAGGNGGGGAGGSFLGLGGAGGLGGDGGAGGVPGAVLGAVTELRGGCPGQDGQDADKGLGGHGGGAVMLIAGTKIDVAAVSINAAGEGGQGGQGNAAGAGGAGAGGMIAFDAPMFTCSNGAVLLATGGGGGEGADSAAAASGDNGSDPTNTSAAAGGSAGSARGGDGGAGAIAPAVAAGPGKPGDSGGSNHGGGGGGGGGAGLIKSFAISNFCTQLAPPATP